jgi:acyl-CoA hydrolase
MKRQVEKKHTVSATRVETAQVVLPGHTNALGTLFGGVVMQWIDVTASIAAARHACGPVVTASMDRLHFLRPVHLEEFVIVKAEVSFAANTSMEVEVGVFSENPWTGERSSTTHALLTFVAIDEQGRPRPVPKLVTKTAGEKRRYAQAARRRSDRLHEREYLSSISAHRRKRNGPNS